MIPLAGTRAVTHGSASDKSTTHMSTTPIAGIFVLLRFLIIDLWIVRMIDGADRVFDAIANGIAACLQAIDDVGPDVLWPISRDMWRGVFTNEQPARLRMFGMSKSAPLLCDAN